MVNIGDIIEVIFFSFPTGEERIPAVVTGAQENIIIAKSLSGELIGNTGHSDIILDVRDKFRSWV